MSSSPKHSFISFTFDQLAKATQDFHESSVIGQGGFGTVYKGCLTIESDLVTVAIKRMRMSLRSHPVLWDEADMLSHLHHPNIVPLIGYCLHEEDGCFLVYEYMPNKSLADHLHSLGTPISWIQRLKICVDAACGLHYLHVVNSHRNLRSSNILLDENWVAKVSDFSVFLKGGDRCFASDNPLGRIGKFDPEYFLTGRRMGRKSDVYAFGVLMLEVLCRKPVSMDIVSLAKVSMKERNLKHIPDPDIRNEIFATCLEKFVRIAMDCLEDDPDSRPNMGQVVAYLEAALDSQIEFNDSTRSRQVIPYYPPKHFVQSCPSIGYHEIVKATDDFKDSLIIGQGSFGKVYKGTITYGTTSVDVAIKSVNPMLIQDDTEFWAEVHMLSKLRHSNIVSLICYCDHEKGKFLVYEYMPKGPLDDHLHKQRTSLSWTQRLKICIGAARGLSYLHHGTHVDSGIIHGDVSSSHILFHENWVPKVSNFGRLLKTNQLSSYDNTRVIGNIGYIDPVYFQTGKLRVKSDVYAFGVVMLELLCRKRVLDENVYGEGVNLVVWAKGFIREGNLKHIPDPDIRDEISPNFLKKFVSIAMRCLDKDLKPRPTMAEVVANLEAVLASQEKLNDSKQRSFGSLLTAGTQQLVKVLSHPWVGHSFELL